MRLLTQSQRILVACAVSLGTLSAYPAAAQTATADLTLTTSATKKLYGDFPQSFTLTIKNQTGAPTAAPVTATGVTIDATVPAGVEVTSVGLECQSTGATRLPCTIADIAGGASVTLTVKLAETTAPTACPIGAALGNAVFTVTAANEANTADNTATSALTDAPYLDLEAAMEGPTNSGDDTTASYTTTVTNHGPCDATTLVVNPSQSGGLSEPLTVTGACEGGFPVKDDPNAWDNGLPECLYGSLAAGGKFSFTTTHQIVKMQSDLVGTTLYNDMTVWADQKDPDASNDTAEAATWVEPKNSGCSSGGAGGAMTLLSLVPLLGMRIRRRG